MLVSRKARGAIMKRHGKLILKILRYVRDNGNGKQLDLPDFHDFSGVQVEYHVRLCCQAGFLGVTETTGLDGSIIMLNEVTWQGHEYLSKHCDG